MIVVVERSFDRRQPHIFRRAVAGRKEGEGRRKGKEREREEEERRAKGKEKKMRKRERERESSCRTAPLVIASATMIGGRGLRQTFLAGFFFSTLGSPDGLVSFYGPVGAGPGRRTWIYGLTSCVVMLSPPKFPCLLVHGSEATRNQNQTSSGADSRFDGGETSFLGGGAQEDSLIV